MTQEVTDPVEGAVSVPAEGGGLLRYREIMRALRGRALPGQKLVWLACAVCGRASERPAVNRCPSCAGPIDAFYDLTVTRIRPQWSSPNALDHYFPLLPLHGRDRMLWTGEGHTPCYELTGLASRFGVRRLFVKDESANPTRSTKDRVAAVGLSRFRELGIHEIVMSSTGNSSTAYARAAQLTSDMTVHVFVGRQFGQRLNYADHPRVLTHVVDGDFVDAGATAKRFAAETGAFWEGGFFNLSRREGLKLAYLEAFDTMPEQPDAVFQAVSSGMGLVGAFKGATEYTELGLLDRVPRLFAVQQASCAPMAHAFGEGAVSIEPRHVIRSPKGLAHAILRGDPTATYPYVRDVCLQSGGAMLAVGDGEIHRARRALTRLSVQACYASSTALAGVAESVRRGLLGRDDVVLVNLTGGDRPPYPIPSALAIRAGTEGRAS